jgi:hypothetical protein
MLIGLVGDMPDMVDELGAWEPISYEEHFERSTFKGKALAIAAYRATLPAIRAKFVEVVWEMDSAILSTIARLKEADTADYHRIAASGGSAGACTSLWLAFHPDMADPKSADPVARESTRLLCAAVSGAQTTLDPKQMKEWTPNSKYGGHAFGFKADAEKKTTQFDAFLAGREKVLPWIAECSPYALVSSDDPPIYLIYAAKPNMGMEEKDPTHTANFGVKLQERLKEAGVECELVYPGAPDVKHPKTTDYLLAKLKAETRSPQTTRRHGVMLVSFRFGWPRPKRCSTKRISDVWSNTSEQTQPPRVHGETTIIGTRWPRPYGPAG